MLQAKNDGLELKQKFLWMRGFILAGKDYWAWHVSFVKM
jgi:hypothetical protein